MARSKLRRCVKAVVYFYVPDKEDSFNYWWNKCPGAFKLFDEHGESMTKTLPFDNIAFFLTKVQQAKNRLFKLRNKA